MKRQHVSASELLRLLVRAWNDPHETDLGPRLDAIVGEACRLLVRHRRRRGAQRIRPDP